ncbi:MAG: bifunctional 5,10-methylenetetrahydrofolate dehydrogenase/5,10-methenyltetrahydrofolate cyclohydrolase [Chloroflexi bacterium]|nr:MAG: bifunctional 5,10-methylenetetrahydrofolate dehydrogenase/5,10-methenyltetrahydrofolate cyclohydrolase [Chloroflexota bacterium]
MRLLLGKPLAEKLYEASRARSDSLRDRGVVPRLAAVSVGVEPAANTYVQRLVSRGRRLGMTVDDVALPGDATERTVTMTLERLGREPAVHGVLLLTPLPGKLDEAHLVDHLARDKDVEGMSPYSAGLLAEGRPRFVPSTAEAIVALLKFYDVPLEGARATIVGRSTVVGRPVALLLLQEHATVTIAHTKTADVAAATRGAEIVVVAVGRAGFLRGEMISKGATIVDAGINVAPRGIVGDVDVASVSSVAGALTPVPGGVGAVTTEILLRNVITAAEQARPE